MKMIKKIELRVRRERLAESTIPYNDTMSRPEDVARVAQSILGGVDQEVFLVIPVDVKNKALGYVEVSKGSVDYCQVDPREVFRAAIVMGATAVFIIHNHPSGDPKYSLEDKSITEKMWEVGNLVGISLMDHVIVAGDKHFSFAEEKLMPRDTTQTNFELKEDDDETNGCG